MRLLAPLVLLASATALADPEAIRISMPPMPARAARASTSVERTDGRVVDRRLPNDVGQLREARVAAPEPVAVKTSAESTREHGVAPRGADADADGGATTLDDDNDLAIELAAHQMRRQERAFDGCKAAALKRAPAAAGRVLLAIDIAERKVR